MPIWPQSTVELEQRQWHWLNVFLATTDANGKPTATTGMGGDSVAYGYRYEGPNGFTTRTLSYIGSASPVTATLAAGYPYTASSLTMKVTATAGTLPPTNGRITVVNGGTSDTVNYKSYNESTGVITFAAGSAPGNTYAVAGTTITRIDWFEAGTGYYSVLVLPTELDQLGTFTVRIGNAGGSTFDVFGQNVEVIPFTGINTSSLPYAPLTCTLFGHVIDLQGNAVQNTSVYTRMLATPIMAYGEGFLDKVVTAKTDSNGFFQLTVAQKTTVQVVIPDIGYSRTITVPQSTQSNLFELA